jgi:hypothetical protein
MGGGNHNRLFLLILYLILRYILVPMFSTQAHTNVNYS